MPGDKSITHRAWILAAIADGESVFRAPLDAADTRSTASALAALGIASRRDDDGAVTVQGVGLEGLRPSDLTLDCGNSGTTARLLLGLLAGSPGDAVLTGDASLRARPMRRVTGPLSAVGARFMELEADDRLPIRVLGSRPLRALRHESPVASAQVKSALLFAGLTGRAPVQLVEPGLSRDHTERLLLGMGAPIRQERSDHGIIHELDVPDRLQPIDLTIPGDFSSAAFFLGLGAFLGPIRVEAVGLNPTRAGALDVLQRMGVPLRIEARDDMGGEPVGTVRVERGELTGTVIEPREVPTLLDEVPMLAALAAVAGGETRFEGVRELRVKETDRLAALATNLRGVGVAVEEGPDRLVVRGRPGARLQGVVRSFGDHRIAMAFGMIGAVPGNDIDVRNAQVVAISYPAFWTEIERIKAELAET